MAPSMTILKRWKNDNVKFFQGIECPPDNQHTTLFQIKEPSI
jgi:hypothetical protein